MKKISIGEISTQRPRRKNRAFDSQMRRSRIRNIIFTGGIGQGDQLTESEVARKYAIEQGIPENRIFIETSSQITYENLIGASKIVTEMGFNRVLIVSDPLHMKRAMTMADDLGLNAFPSPTPTSAYISFQRRSKFLLREIFFYAGYLLQRPFL